MISTQVTKKIYMCVCMLKFMTHGAGSVTGIVELGDINFHFFQYSSSCTERQKISTLFTSSQATY